MSSPIFPVRTQTNASPLPRSVKKRQNSRHIELPALVKAPVEAPHGLEGALHAQLSQQLLAQRRVLGLEGHATKMEVAHLARPKTGVKEWVKN